MPSSKLSEDIPVGAREAKPYFWGVDLQRGTPSANIFPPSLPARRAFFCPREDGVRDFGLRTDFAACVSKIPRSTLGMTASRGNGEDNVQDVDEGVWKECCGLDAADQLATKESGQERAFRSCRDARASPAIQAESPSPRRRPRRAVRRWQRWCRRLRRGWQRRGRRNESREWCGRTITRLRANERRNRSRGSQRGISI